MFSFKRDGRAVTLWVSADVPGYEYREFPFAFNCRSEDYAALLLSLLQNTYSETVQFTNSESYWCGYEDGKKRKKKQKHFSGEL